MILLKDCQLVNKLLVQLSTQKPIARNQAAKLLIETALYPPVSPIFGATVKPDPDVITTNNTSLLKENIKQVTFYKKIRRFCTHCLIKIFTQGNTLMVAQSAMSVFHTGIIGSGLRETYIRARLSEERIKVNTQHLMDAIYSC